MTPLEHVTYDALAQCVNMGVIIKPHRLVYCETRRSILINIASYITIEKQ